MNARVGIGTVLPQGKVVSITREGVTVVGQSGKVVLTFQQVESSIGV